MKTFAFFSLLLFCVLQPLDARAAFFVFSSESVSVRAGDTFVVSIAVDPEAERTYTAKLALLFPPDLLEATSFTFDADWIPLPQPGYDAVDNDLGELIKTAGFPRGFVSREPFGTITFRARQSGQGTVAVGSHAFVLNADGDDTTVLSPTLQVDVSQSEPSPPSAEPPATGQPTPVSPPTMPEELPAAVEPEPVERTKNLFDILSAPVQAATKGSPWPFVMLIGLGVLFAVLLRACITRFRRWRLGKKIKKEKLLWLVVPFLVVFPTVANAQVAPGEFLPVSIQLQNFGNQERVDVTVSYLIVDAEEDAIYAADETVAVQTTASFVKMIQIPSDTPPGRYVAKSSVLYPDQLVPATTEFPFAVERKIAGLYESDFYLYGGTTLLVSFAAGLLGHAWIRRRRTRIAPHDYSRVPRNERVFYELMSDTIAQMRQHVGDAALDIAQSIDGLVVDGKTGRVLDMRQDASKLIAKLISAYEDLLGRKVSFALRKPGADPPRSSRVDKKLVVIKKT